jgi:hypothetical protein
LFNLDKSTFCIGNPTLVCKTELRISVKCVNVHLSNPRRISKGTRHISFGSSKTRRKIQVWFGSRKYIMVCKIEFGFGAVHKVRHPILANYRPPPPSLSQIVTKSQTPLNRTSQTTCPSSPYLKKARFFFHPNFLFQFLK